MDCHLSTYSYTVRVEEIQTLLVAIQGRIGDSEGKEHPNLPSGRADLSMPLADPRAHHHASFSQGISVCTNDNMSFVPCSVWNTYRMVYASYSHSINK